MNDVELESLLEEAGYRYDPIDRRYIALDDAAEYTSEAIADELEVPIADLQRWEAEQESLQEPRA